MSRVTDTGVTTNDFKIRGDKSLNEGSKPVHLIFRSRRLRFEGGDAILDALIVNFSNRRGIAFTGGPNVHAVHVWTFARTITLVPLTPLIHRSLAQTPAALRARPAWRT